MRKNIKKSKEFFQNPLTKYHFYGIIHTSKDEGGDTVERLIKKLIKLLEQLNELMIKIIELAGWVIILIDLFD